MSQEQGFLDAIIEEPDDDGLRLIYADWLQEHENPRGEFIRVQVELARMAPDDPRRPELAARERELLSQHEDEWVAPLWEFQPWQYTFRRGFVEELSIPDTVFLDRGEQLVRLAPVLYLHLGHTEGPARAAGLAGSPALARLRGLDLGGWPLGDLGLQALAESPYLANLHALGLADCVLRVTEDSPLLDLLSRLPRLIALNLSDNTVGDVGLAALADAPALSGLRTLRLAGQNEIPFRDLIHAQGAAALAVSAYLTQLTELDLSGNAVGDAGLRHLANSPALQKLKNLDLGNNGIGEIGDAGIEALAGSDRLQQLTVLALGQNPLGIPGARALAGWPGLARLEVLNLQQCWIRDVGLEALLTSGLGSCLRELDLRHNDLRDRGGRALAEASTLSDDLHLNLQGNWISDECGMALRNRFGEGVLLDLLIA
jgi:uncharacterized protein (TIGR02996 family)